MYKSLTTTSEIDAMTPGCMDATTPSCTGATTPGGMNATDNIKRAYIVLIFNFNNTKKTMGDLLSPRAFFVTQIDFREKAVAAM